MQGETGRRRRTSVFRGKTCGRGPESRKKGETPQVAGMECTGISQVELEAK